MQQLLRFTNRGIYCQQGDFYIDPWRPVDRALITHAHSDHSRWGNKYYLAHKDSEAIMHLRLGADINLQTVDFNTPITINGVKVTFHPAGHIIGSAQIRVEYEGEVWVFSGDYKTEDDGISGAFEPIKCHTFITESTFGLPVYRWKPQPQIFSEINNWWDRNKAAGKNSMLFCYSLGKAQRVLQYLDKEIGNIYAHTSVYNAQKALIDAGQDLYPVEHWANMKDKEKGIMIVATPSAQNTPWTKRFEPVVDGVCSGWMQVRGAQRRRNADAGFALSDHADWNGLLSAVKATGAQKVFVTHGFQSTFARYLNETGIEAEEVKTEYGDESGDDIAETTNETGTA